MSSNVKAALIGVVAIALAIAALLLFVRGRNNANAINTHLQTVANQLSPRLQQPGGGWTTAPSFKEKYRQFAAREQAVIERSTRRMPRQQFVQIQLVPRQGAAHAILLTSRPGSRVVVPPVALLLTATTRQPRYVTVQQRGAMYQVFLKPLDLPEPFRGQHVAAVLEVVQG